MGRMNIRSVYKHYFLSYSTNIGTDIIMLWHTNVSETATAVRKMAF